MSSGRWIGRENRLWRGTALGAGAAAGGWAALCAAETPSGLGLAADLTAWLAVYAAGLVLSGAAGVRLVALLKLPWPGFAIGCLVYAGLWDFFVFHFAETGAVASAIAALVSLGASALAGACVGAWADRRRTGWRRPLLLTAAVLAAGVGGYAAVAWGGGGAADVSAFPGERLPPPLAADPAEPGPYAYRTYTYGSGDDRFRQAYGDGADWVTRAVDGSAVVSGWRPIRTWWWGFDETELPLNGRVYLPEGAGPFPLVLMAHGNHAAEDFSEDGYGYLGELLASRGYVFVSIDANFLNHSVWSGIPKPDMKARAWLLLQHLRQLEASARDPETPLYGKLDLDRVVFMGHSRGGQAAAMAADRERWFPDGTGLPDPDGYTVRGVVALAPTDFDVDGRQVRLTDVPLLTLHGARDTDLTSFYGDRLYNRTTFSPGAAAGGRFKASLYIGDANHGQFNTTWGRRDNALPLGLLLDTRSLLSGDDQRQIARLYVSAFLEDVVRGDRSYRALFRDYRTARSLLPETRYVSRYESEAFRAIERFERVADAPATDAGSGLTVRRVEEATDRQGLGKGAGSRALTLGWEQEGAYTFDRGETDPAAPADGRGSLSFSLSVLALDPAARIEVELTDRAGRSARVALGELRPLLPPQAVRYTWLPLGERWIAKGKYKHPTEPVFQTYEAPLARLLEANPELQPDRWSAVTFRFSGGPGRIRIDDLGFEPD